MKEIAADACVSVVTGDTKVVEKNKCDVIYINTTGIGEIIKPMTVNDVANGDVVIVTGTLGDHGISVALNLI